MNLQVSTFEIVQIILCIYYIGDIYIYIYIYIYYTNISHITCRKCHCACQRVYLATIDSYN